MVDRDNSNGGLGFGGLLRNIGEMLHQAANMSAAGRRDGQRPSVESRMSIRSVDGEDIGADFFGLRDQVASATASPEGNQSDDETPRSADRREPAVELFATSDAISGVVQIRVTPKTRNTFTIRALSISGVTRKWHFLNHALPGHQQRRIA